MAVKKIKDIYEGYFQKSRVFLHPVLGHKRGTSVTPIDTFLCWEDIVEVEDNKLVCLHHLRDDEHFRIFEEKHLFGNPLFEDYKEVSHDKAVYIFNLEDHKHDFQCVVRGKYSQMSHEQKLRIREYYGASTANYAFIDTYLYPEKYFLDYAKFLCVDPADVPEMRRLLWEVGELCSLPDLEKETLKMKVQTLDFKKI